jgi:CheY-like chemotaxis protein
MIKLKVLLLEDDPYRIDKFKELFEEHKFEYRITEHAADCIRELKESKFDVIFLDHDLNGKQIEYDEDDCGTVVAEWINKNPVKGRIIIHSMNIFAVERMLKLIPDSVYISHVWEKKVFQRSLIPFIQKIKEKN